MTCVVREVYRMMLLLKILSILMCGLVMGAGAGETRVDKDAVAQWQKHIDAAEKAGQDWDTKRAVKELEAALAIAEKFGETDGRLHQTLHLLGDAHYDPSAKELRCVEIWQRAVALMEAQPQSDKVLLAKVYNGIGSSLYSQALLRDEEFRKKSIPWLKKAAELRATLQPRPSTDVLEYFKDWGMQLYFLNEYANTIPILEKAASEAEALLAAGVDLIKEDCETTAFDAFERVAKSEAELGEHERAVKAWQRYLKFAETFADKKSVLGDPVVELWKIYLDLGQSQRAAGKDADAEASLLKALELGKESVGARKELAALYYDAGNLPKAEPHWAWLLENRRALSAHDAVRIYKERGILRRNAGREEEALADFLEARKVAEQDKKPWPVLKQEWGYVEYLLAQAYLKKKDAAKADLHAKKCVALFEEIHEKGDTEVATAYAIFARVSFFADREEDADAALKKAIKVCEDAGEEGREALLETLNEALGFYHAAERETERRAIEERLGKLRK
jgi:hypothetical protein